MVVDDLTLKVQCLLQSLIVIPHLEVFFLENCLISVEFARVCVCVCACVRACLPIPNQQNEYRKIHVCGFMMFLLITNITYRPYMYTGQPVILSVSVHCCCVHIHMFQ